MRTSLSTRFGVLCSLAALACGRSGLDLTDNSPGSGGTSGAGSAGAPGGEGGASENPGLDGSAPGKEGLCAPGQGQACEGSIGFATSDDSGTGDSSNNEDGGGAPHASETDATDNVMAEPGRVLYTGCSMLGALDCSSQDAKIRLLCDGMTWNPIGVCSGQQVCDTQPGPDHGLCTGSATGAAPGPGGNSPSGGVVLYSTCSALGATDCSSKDPMIQVLCDGMTWGPIGVCSGKQVCDAQPGPDQGLCKDP